MSRRLMSQMNVVPYIDVMLVLLIIFMVTSHLVKPKTPERVREEIKRGQQELKKQKVALDKIQKEFNTIEIVKEQEVQNLQKIKKDAQSEQVRLAELKNQQEDEIQKLELSRQQLEKQVTEAQSRLDEFKRGQQYLKEQEAKLAKIREEFNAIKTVKEQEMTNLEKLRKNVQVEQSRLDKVTKTRNQRENEVKKLESSRQQLEEQLTDTKSRLDEVKREQQESAEKKETLDEIRIENEELRDKLSQTREDVRKLQKDLENRILVAKSIRMCNHRNYTMSIALTYTRDHSPYSEGWYILPPDECKTVQIRDATDSKIFLYEKNSQLVGKRAKFCVNMYKRNFAIQSSDNEYFCEGQMIPIEHMGISCIVGDGGADFIQ